MEKPKKYEVFIDAKAIQALFEGYSPFNLVKDFKNDLKESPEWLGKEIEAAFIQQSYAVLLEETVYKLNSKFQLIKLRVKDPSSNKGKSGGYRCIVLIDWYSKFVIPVHLYFKPSEEKLTEIQNNLLNDLLKGYINSVLHELK